MNSKRIVLGIGIALAMTLVFTAPAMAGPNTAYFVPQQSSADLGEITYVEVWLNITDPIGIDPTYTFEGADIDIHFDPSIGDITTVTWMPGTNTIWDAYREKYHYSDSWWLGVGSAAWGDEPPYGLGPGVYPVVNLTIESNNTGVMDIDFDHVSPRVCNMYDAIGQPYTNNQTWVDGTYTCTGPAETFEKELVAGWNLISLPLTADDMEVASVFASVSSNYSAIHRYDAETKHFMALSADNVLEYGVGYFIHMTSADTWTYQGTAYSSMSVDLEQGLNMVGWLNGTKDIEDALSSIEGNRYAARWNAQAQKYEVYVPNAPAEFNDFDTMEQGRGYFISMKVDGETLSGVC